MGENLQTEALNEINKTLQEIVECLASIADDVHNIKLEYTGKGEFGERVH
jgi:hypothetical protein